MGQRVAVADKRAGEIENREGALGRQCRIGLLTDHDVPADGVGGNDAFSQFLGYQRRGHDRLPGAIVNNYPPKGNALRFCGVK